MISNKRPEILTDPAETVKLYRSYGTTFDVNQAMAVAMEYQRQVKPSYREWRYKTIGDGDVLWMLGAIYEAGRLQGIREERRKRK